MPDGFEDHQWVSSAIQKWCTSTTTTPMATYKGGWRAAAPMNYTFVVFIKSAITWLKGCMIQDVSVLDTKANNSLNKQH